MACEYHDVVAKGIHILHWSRIRCGSHIVFELDLDSGLRFVCLFELANGMFLSDIIIIS